MEKQPVMQTIREIAENPAVIATSAVLAAVAVKDALFPSSANASPLVTASADICDAFATKPCDTGERFSVNNKSDVTFCQDEAIGLDVYDDPGMIKQEDIRYKLGSDKVTVTYTVDGMESWRNKAFSGACAEVTDSSSSQKVIHVAGKDPKKINPSTGFTLAPNSPQSIKYKSVSNSQTIEGPTNTAFVPSHARTGGDFQVKRTFAMDRPLTSKNVKAHDICIRGVVNSRGKGLGVKAKSGVELYCVRPDQVKGYSNKKH